MVSAPTPEHMCTYNETSYINGKTDKFKGLLLNIKQSPKIMSQLFGILPIHTHTLIDANAEVGPTFLKETVMFIHPLFIQCLLGEIYYNRHGLLLVSKTEYSCGTWKQLGKIDHFKYDVLLIHASNLKPLKGWRRMLTESSRPAWPIYLVSLSYRVRSCL